MSALKIGGSVAKIIFFELCKNNYKKIVNFHLQSVKAGGRSLARNALFGASKFQAGRSFLRFARQGNHFRSVVIE